MQPEHIDRYKAVGRNIAFYRKSMGYSQDALADKVGISRTHLSRIETASCAASFDILFNLADVLDIDPCLFIQNIGWKSDGATEKEHALISDLTKCVIRHMREP